MKTSAVAGAVAVVALCAALGGLAVRATQAQGEATAATEGPVLTISPVEDGGIQICWDPINGARCRVLRAADAGGPYEPVSDWLTEPGFVDVDAPASGAFYRVEVEEQSGLGLLPTDGDPPAPSAEELAATIASLHDEGRHQEAADLAADYLDGHPVRDLDRQWIQYLYARQLLWLQDYAAARVQIEGLIADYRDLLLDESLPEVFVDDAKYLLGWLELHQGDPLLALAGLTELVATSPGSDRAADALFLANRVLIDHVDRPGATPPVSRKAEIEANLDRVKHDWPESERIAQMTQDYLVYLIKRPTLANRAEAMTVAEGIRADYPGTSHAEYALEEIADMKTLWGDEQARQEAAAILDQQIAEAAAADRTDRVAHWNYYKCKLLRREGRFSEARDLAAASMALEPTFLPFEYRLQVVCALRAEGRPDAARQTLIEMEQQYATDDSQRALALYLQGVTYADQGDLSQAIEILEQVRAGYPQTATATVAEDDIRRYLYARKRP